MLFRSNPAKFALPAAARSNTAIIGFVPNTGSPVAANKSLRKIADQFDDTIRANAEAVIAKYGAIIT